MPSDTLYFKSGAFIASESEVSVDTSWGGARGFFSGAGLILLQLTGVGQVLVGSYGAIEARDLMPGVKYFVDTGHIVGFEGTVGFQIKTIGGWKSTLLSGEGLVCEMTGPGRILMQTRSEEALIGWMSARMPSKSSGS